MNSNPYEPTKYTANRPHPVVGILVGVVCPAVIVLVVTWLINVWHRWYWGLSFQWWL